MQKNPGKCRLGKGQGAGRLFDVPDVRQPSRRNATSASAEASTCPLATTSGCSRGVETRVVTHSPGRSQPSAVRTHFIVGSTAGCASPPLVRHASVPMPISNNEMPKITRMLSRSGLVMAPPPAVRPRARNSRGEERGVRCGRRGGCRSAGGVGPSSRPVARTQRNAGATSNLRFAAAVRTAWNHGAYAQTRSWFPGTSSRPRGNSSTWPPHR